MAGKKTSENKISMKPIREIMDLILPLPRVWLLIMVVAILLSMFEVTLNADGAATAIFRLTSITAILVALIWLPTLLRIIGLAGGGIKTAAGEVTTPGLLKLLVNVVATLDTVEANLPADQKERVREVREEAERRVASLSPSTEETRRRLKQLGQRYEELRRSMPAGGERTYKMTALVAEARALASQAEYSQGEIRDLYQRGTDGERIIALSLIRADPEVEVLDVALEAVKNSRSAFEQYQSLRIIDDLAYSFQDEERTTVSDVIKDQRQEGPGKWIHRGTDRWHLSERILSKINRNYDQP